MKVLKKFKEPNAKWEEVTLEKAIEDLEGGGAWKKNTVKDMLEDGQTLWTPWSHYKIKTEED